MGGGSITSGQHDGCSSPELQRALGPKRPFTSGPSKPAPPTSDSGHAGGLGDRKLHRTHFSQLLCFDSFLGTIRTSLWMHEEEIKAVHDDRTVGLPFDALSVAVLDPGPRSVALIVTYDRSVSGAEDSRCLPLQRLIRAIRPADDVVTLVFRAAHSHLLAVCLIRAACSVPQRASTPPVWGTQLCFAVFDSKPPV